ncbi:MAG: carboxypeptidase-like regulatory domain-containing protein [Planctomycetota bacterium]
MRNLLTSLLAIALALAAPAQAPKIASAEDARAALAAMPVHEPVADGLAVRVIDGLSQEPVAGADVFAIRENPDLSALDDVPALKRRGYDQTLSSLVIAALFGTRYRTGDDGAVRIADVGRRGSLVVVAGERVGGGRPSRQAVIEVYAPHAVDVVVRTADGKPMRGVPVGVGHASDTLVTGLEPPLTDRDGRCHLAVDRMLGLDVFVGALGAFAAPCVKKVDLRKADAGPVELTVPACGQVRFILYGPDEKPATGLTTAFLRLAPDPKAMADMRGARPTSAMPSVVAADNALFPLVEIGREVVVTAHVQGVAKPLQFRGNGPARAGELVVVDGRLTVGPPVLSFRLVDQQGRPVGNEKVGLVGRDAQYFGMTDAETDGEGRLTVPLLPEQATSFYVLRRRASAATEYLGAAHREFAGPQRGPQDLGDLQLVDEPVVARGRLVDADGKPIAGLWVRGSTSITTGSGGGGWSGQHWFFEHRVQTGADGVFELRELAPQDVPIAVTPEGGDWIAPAKLEVKQGTQQPQEFRLSRPSTIAARFAGEDLAGLDFRVRLVHEQSGTMRETQFQNGVLGPMAWAAGTYDVRIGDPEMEFTIAGVEAPAGGAVDDPRLAAIAVPATHFGVRVTVVDDGDRPVPGAWVMCEAVRGQGRSGSGTPTAKSGKAVVLLRREGAEVSVRKDGFETARVKELAGEVRVVLKRVAAVAVKFAGLPELPAPLRYTTQWTRAGGGGRSMFGNFEGDTVRVQPTQKGTWRVVVVFAYDGRPGEDVEVQRQVLAALGGAAIAFDLDVGETPAEMPVLELSKEQRDDLVERIAAAKAVLAEHKDK